MGEFTVLEPPPVAGGTTMADQEQGVDCGSRKACNAGTGRDALDS